MSVSSKRNIKKLLQKTSIMIFVLMMMISSQANLNSFDSDNGYSLDDYNFDKIKAQALLEDSNLNTGAINITIQQTYTNSTDVSLDQDNNHFTTPAPTSSDYSSSIINISVKDISISNKTNVIEDETSLSFWHDVNNVLPSVTSFSVPSSCYLVNASFYVRRTLTQDGMMKIRLYNSTWNSTLSRSVPHSSVSQYTNLGEIGVGNNWISNTSIMHFLNTSTTDNNTWFIGLVDENNVNYNGNWWFVEDSSGDGIDDTLSYEYAGGGTWALIENSLNPGAKVDFISKVGLSLNTTTPDPSDVNLAINGTAVDDSTSNKGEWIDTSSYSGSNGKLNFTFSADWYDFSVDVDQIDIDYIKYKFDELTEYSVELNQLVYWNSSVNITEFDSRFSSNEINFTIPYDWTVTDLQNETTTITYSTTSSQPTKTVRVTGASATNGKWALEASSANYGTSVSSYVGGSAVSLANYSNDVIFQAAFDDVLSGDVNLSVFDPSQSMKYTFENASVSNKQTIYFPSYDLSDNVTEYGEYSMQTYWMNTTHIGYWENNFTVLADTSLSSISPAQDNIYNSTDVFTIALYFENTGLSTPIDGATIYYDIDGEGQQSISSNNGTSGYYEIDVDCSLLTGNGDKIVEITSNKTYYNNQTLDFNFRINTPPTITDEPTLQGLSSWTQDEDFGTFNVDLTAYESDLEDLDPTNLDWWVSGLDPLLAEVQSGEYSDNDVITFQSVSDAFDSDQFTLWLGDSYGLTDSVLI
ncbi:MAG: hypothetical protein ACTSRD_13515, partial [Promethearchaeota archaeon]